MIQLRELTAAEFEKYRADLVEGFAEEIARTTGVTMDDARAAAARQVDSLLSQGVATPNQTVYTLVLDDSATPADVGYLWLDFDEAAQSGFVRDLFVFDAYRGRGVAKRTMELAEQCMRERGLPRITLHVAADNAIARGLYTKQGYQTVRLTMQKSLVGAEPANEVID